MEVLQCLLVLVRGSVDVGEGRVHGGPAVGPVQETATCPSAQQPAPRMGLSPTRPSSLFSVPPVEVAAARRPDVSSATQPTVPVAIEAYDKEAPGTPLFRSSTFDAALERKEEDHNRPIGERILNLYASGLMALRAYFDAAAEGKAPMPSRLTSTKRSSSSRAVRAAWTAASSPARVPTAT